MGSNVGDAAGDLEISLDADDHNQSSTKIKLHDKVVWISESEPNIPRTGKVNWIGNSFDETGQYYAGIAFENSSAPLTSGRGFNCRLTRDQFVPVTELVLFNEFYPDGNLTMETAPIPQQSHFQEASRPSFLMSNRINESIQTASAPYPPPNQRFNPNTNSFVSDDKPSLRVQLNDKVVWFTSEGIPEACIVRWIGKNHKDGNGEGGGDYAGIEFESEAGNCSGELNGTQYFTTPTNHARFVDMNELILYTDFYGVSAPAPRAKRKRPAPFLCVICHDSVFGAEGAEESEEENHVPVSTVCGHVFHKDCLETWFKTDKKTDRPCPYCQTMMTASDIRRLFPVQ